MDTYVSYRGFYNTLDTTYNSKSISEWVTLEENQPYFIRATHRESGGDDHMTVAVEIERPTTTTPEGTVPPPPHHH